MMKRSGLTGLLAMALVLCSAGILSAQVPEGWVEVGQGTVKKVLGATIVVDVTEGANLGMNQFTLTSDSQALFMRDGEKVDSADLKEGDIVQAYRHPEYSVLVIDEGEVLALKDGGDSDSARTVPAKKETLAATLPATGSRLPLILMLGLMFLGLGAGQTFLRR